MKNAYKYGLPLILIAFVFAFFLMNTRHKQLLLSSDYSSNKSPHYVRADIGHTSDENRADNRHGLDKIALEISREICKQERQALWEITGPSLKNVKPGTLLPLDSETKLSPSQAIEWLKKTANSKCSSFRKNNAERLFFQFILDKDNYRIYHDEFNRVLAEYRGLAPYQLIRKSLKALDEATPGESKSLKDAILFSLSTYVSDASAFVDIVGSVLALKEVKEKGLISYPTSNQIDALEKALGEARDENIRKAKQLIGKYFPSDINFMNITEDEHIDFLGYEGTKANLDFEREEYEMVRQLAGKLNDLMRENI